MPAALTPGALGLRAEAAGDEAAVGAVLACAFRTKAEADLVERLRRDGDAALALVAMEGGKGIGHVMFVRLRAPDGALGLGPLAVVPEHQRRGIGALLVREGLARAARAGWRAVFVLGDPSYYGRFGFSAALAAGFASPYAGPHFMALALGPGGLPAGGGTVTHPPAFAGLG